MDNIFTIEPLYKTDQNNTWRKLRPQIERKLQAGQSVSIEFSCGTKHYRTAIDERKSDQKELVPDEWWYKNSNAIDVRPIVYKSEFPIPPSITPGTKKWKQTFIMFVLNLYYIRRTHKNSRCLSVLIDKGNQFFPGGRNIIEDIIKQLTAVGYIEVRKGCKGFSTKVRLTDYGYSALSYIDLKQTEVDCRHRVFYKDSKGKRRAATEEEAKRVGLDTLIDYQKLLYGSDIRVGGERVPTPDKTVFRLFHTKELIYDGRLQGACWMNMEGALRDTLTINGNPTCEVDIRSTQSTIFYGLVGAPLPEEIYYCDLLPKGKGDNSWLAPMARAMCKRIMVLLLSIEAPIKNGMVDQAALITEVKRAFYDYKNADETVKSLQRYKNTLEKDYNIPLEDVIKSLIERHKAISKCFGRGSWKNANLYESNILLRVIKHFSNKPIPVPVLTVHDSFIIDEQHKEELIEVITLSINAELGSSFTSDQVLKVK